MAVVANLTLTEVAATGTFTVDEQVSLQIIDDTIYPQQLLKSANTTFSTLWNQATTAQRQHYLKLLLAQVIADKFGITNINGIP